MVTLQEQEKQQYMKEKVDNFKELEKWLSSQQYVTGNKLNIMDFVLFESLDAHNAAMPEFLGQFPNLQQYHQRMMVSVTILFASKSNLNFAYLLGFSQGLKGVKEYLTSDRNPKAFNGPMAKWGG